MTHLVCMSHTLTSQERQARAAAGLSDTDALPYRALYTDELASDMRLPLLTALLRQQAWAHAGRLWLNLQSKTTEDGHRLQPAMDAGVSQALCDAAAPLLAPLCQAVWPNGRWMAPAELQVLLCVCCCCFKTPHIGGRSA